MASTKTSQRLLAILINVFILLLEISAVPCNEADTRGLCTETHILLDNETINIPLEGRPEIIIQIESCGNHLIELTSEEGDVQLTFVIESDQIHLQGTNRSMVSACAEGSGLKFWAFWGFADRTLRLTMGQGIDVGKSMQQTIEFPSGTWKYPDYVQITVSPQSQVSLYTPYEMADLLWSETSYDPSKEFSFVHTRGLRSPDQVLLYPDQVTTDLVLELPWCQRGRFELKADNDYVVFTLEIFADYRATWSSPHGIDHSFISDPCETPFFNRMLMVMDWSSNVLTTRFISTNDQLFTSTLPTSWKTWARPTKFAISGTKGDTLETSFGFVYHFPCQEHAENVGNYFCESDFCKTANLCLWAKDETYLVSNGDTFPLFTETRQSQRLKLLFDRLGNYTITIPGQGSTVDLHIVYSRISISDSHSNEVQDLGNFDLELGSSVFPVEIDWRKYPALDITVGLGPKYRHNLVPGGTVGLIQLHLSSLVKFTEMVEFPGIPQGPSNATEEGNEATPSPEVLVQAEFLAGMVLRMIEEILAMLAI